MQLPLLKCHLGNDSHCLLHVKFFFPVDLLEFLFIQLFNFYCLLSIPLMLDYYWNSLSHDILICFFVYSPFPSMKKRQSPAPMSGTLPEAPSAMAATLYHRGDCQEPRNKPDLLWIQLATALSLLILGKSFTFWQCFGKGKESGSK